LLEYYDALYNDLPKFFRCDKFYHGIIQIKNMIKLKYKFKLKYNLNLGGLKNDSIEKKGKYSCYGVNSMPVVF